MQNTTNYSSQMEKQLDDVSDSGTQQEEEKGRIETFIKDPEVIQLLHKKGIQKLFPIQYETFNLILKGEDLIAKDRTGSGKTLAFALPVITRLRQQNKIKGNHNPKFMIILPTRQLSIQVRDQIASLKFKNRQDFYVTAIYGGSSIQKQIDDIFNGTDIVVGTPGRLIDLLSRKAIDLNCLETIVLDQADEMLNIGFKEDIEKIFQFIKLAKCTHLQCLFFSATIPDWVRQISHKYQKKNKTFINMMKDSNLKTSKTVQHYCLKASSMQKQAYIGCLIKHFMKGKSGKILIFCETRREVDRIGKSGLISLNLRLLHGEISQMKRQKIFKQFKLGEAQCLIATNVAARGLDFPEIDLIIQMQPPNKSEEYIHRSGRTGRAGKFGVCVTLYSYKEEVLMKKIEGETMILLHHINQRDLAISTSSTPENKVQTQNDLDNKTKNGAMIVPKLEKNIENQAETEAEIDY